MSYTADIAVVTKVSNGNYLPGVHVTIWDENNNFVHQGDTGFDGTYRYLETRSTPIGSGQYRARCEKQLYYPAEAFLVNTPAAAPPNDYSLSATVIMIPVPPDEGGEGGPGGEG